MKSKIFFVAAFLCLLTHTSSSQKITNLAPDRFPPASLPIKNTPQFIFIGSDDQNNLAGLENILNMLKEYKNPQGRGKKATFDGEPIRFSFFSLTSRKNPDWMRLHQRALDEGHELGLHTHSHPYISSRQEAIDQYSLNLKELTEVLISDSGDTVSAISTSVIAGIRAPYLYVSDWVFDALDTLNLRYDCSLEEGMDTAITSLNGFVWPYTAGGASSGWTYLSDVMKSVPNQLSSHPGKWEIPAYPLFFIPDSLKGKYGITRPQYDQNRFNNAIFISHNGRGELGVSPDGKKMSGLDNDAWNIQNWTGDEFAMTLLYNLELRLAGNRVPLAFGIHSNYYTDANPDHLYGLKKFIDIALTFPEVRFVTGSQLIDWMEDPVVLDNNPDGGKD